MTAFAEKCMTLEMFVRSAISIQAPVTIMFPRKMTAPAMWRNRCHPYGNGGKDTTTAAMAKPLLDYYGL